MAGTAGAAVKVPPVEHFELFLVMQQLRQATADRLDEMGISSENMIGEAMINPVQVRNTIIRAEYHTKRESGEKHDQAVCDLSVQHDLSYAHIKDVIKKKR